MCSTEIMNADMGLSLNRRHFNAGSCALMLATALDAWAKTQGPLLVVGDSLSAEYGLKRGSGWVALLEQRLRQQGKTLAVVNASISGETTSGGRSRLPALLAQHRPQLVVIELGGNDALRGLALNASQDNLQAMVQACQGVQAKVLLLGMQMPPNYGPDYSAEFTALYARVAKTRGVALVPFFLKGVADVPQADTLFQSDRIHPLEAAHPTLLDNVWPALSKMIA
jgi:acyl-CoA thioesterase-1